MTLLEEELHPTQHTEVAKMYLNLIVEWIKVRRFPPCGGYVVSI
jgi:hypothetical protein